jgi:hypothetical protein
MLGGFLHICTTCTCTIYCGLWPSDNTSCIFLTWYQSLGLSFFFWHAQLVPFSLRYSCRRPPFVAVFGLPVLLVLDWLGRSLPCPRLDHVPAARPRPPVDPTSRAKQEANPALPEIEPSRPPCPRSSRAACPARDRASLPRSLLTLRSLLPPPRDPARRSRPSCPRSSE